MAIDMHYRPVSGGPTAVETIHYWLDRFDRLSRERELTQEERALANFCIETARRWVPEIVGNFNHAEEIKKQNMAVWDAVGRCEFFIEPSPLGYDILIYPYPLPYTQPGPYRVNTIPYPTAEDAAEALAMHAVIWREELLEALRKQERPTRRYLNEDERCGLGEALLPVAEIMGVPTPYGPHPDYAEPLLREILDRFDFH